MRAPLRSGRGQPARFRPRRAGRVLRAARREALPRHAAVPLDPPAAARPTSTPMTDLAKSLRDKLAGAARRSRALAVLSEQASADGTVKWLFDVGGGNAVETVFIPEDDRGTLCVSSQAGCAVGCRFCSTGHQGFSRNLTTGEIVAQLWYAEHELRQRLGRPQASASSPTW